MWCLVPALLLILTVIWVVMRGNSAIKRSTRGD